VGGGQEAERGRQTGKVNEGEGGVGWWGGGEVGGETAREKLGSKTSEKMLTPRKTLGER